MSSNKSVGIIGAGFGQYVHYPAFKSRKDCLVRGICASTKTKSLKIHSLLKTPVAYTGWKSLLEDGQVDTVSISVPPYLQCRIGREILKTKKRVCFEKPLGINSVETAALLRLAKKRNVRCVVDYEMITLPEFQEAKRLIAEGVIGRIRHVSVRWNVQTYAVKHRLKNWKTVRSKGGGSLLNFGSHTMHYLLWFLGKPKSIYASLETAADLKAASDTASDLILNFRSGVTASASISIHAQGCHEHTIDFFGSKGRMTLSNLTPDYIRGFELSIDTEEKSRKKVRRSGRAGRFSDGRIEAFSKVISALFDSSERVLRKDLSLESAHQVQKCLDKAFESHKKGKRIRIV